MLQNAYFLAKIGADRAENEQHFAEICQKLATTLPCGGAGRRTASARRRREERRAATDPPPWSGPPRESMMSTGGVGVMQQD